MARRKVDGRQKAAEGEIGSGAEVAAMVQFSKNLQLACTTVC